MSQTRDQRDPEKLGRAIMIARKSGLPWDIAVQLPAPNVPDEGPIERYGEPGKCEPKWATIQVR